MTLMTLFCVPTVIAVGTMFGALLRTTSRAAQAQVKFSFLKNFLKKKQGLI